MGAHQGTQLGYRQQMGTLADQQVEVLFEQRQPDLFQPRSLLLRVRAGNTGQRFSPPECERLPDPLGRLRRPPGRAVPGRLGRKLLGPYRVDVAGIQDQPVAVTHGDEGAWLGGGLVEGPAQAPGVGPHHGRRRVRRLLAPHSVDELRHRGGPTGPQEQHRQHRLLLWRTDVDGPLRAGGAQLAEDGEPDAVRHAGLRAVARPVAQCGRHLRPTTRLVQDLLQSHDRPFRPRAFSPVRRQEDEASGSGATPTL